MTKKKKKILKIAGISAGAIAALILLIFLYISRGGFIDSQVLPRVADFIGLPVESEDTSFSVFGGIEFTNFKVDNDLLAADTIKVEYKLMPLITSQTLVVEQILIDGLVVKADDIRINKLLETILGEETKKASPVKTAKKDAAKIKPKKPAEESSPFQVNIKSIILKNCSFQYSMPAEKISFKADAFNLTIKDIKNNSPFTIDLKNELHLVIAKDNIDIPGMNLTLTGKLRNDLMPEELKLDFSTGEISGSVAGLILKDRSIKVLMLAGMQGNDLLLKSLKLSETHGAKEELTVQMDGKAALNGKSAELNIHVNMPDASLLNIIKECVPDYEIALASLDYKAKINLKAASKLSLNGEFSLAGLSVNALSLNKTTPDISISSRQQIDFDLNSNILVLKALNAEVSAKTKKEKILSVQFPEDWHFNLNTFSADNLDLPIIFDIDHNLLKSLYPEIPDVEINNWHLYSKDLKLSVKENGQSIKLSGTVLLDDIFLLISGKKMRGLSVQNHLNISIDSLKKSGDDLLGIIKCDDTRLIVKQRDDVWLKLELANGYNLATNMGNPQIFFSVPDLSKFRHYIPKPIGISRLNGNIYSNVSIAVSNMGETLHAKGKLNLDKFHLAGNLLDEPLILPKTAFSFDSSYDKGKVLIQNTALAVFDRKGKLIDLTIDGNYDPDKESEIIIDLKPLSFARLAHFIPKSVGIEKLEGKMATKISIKPIDDSVQCNGLLTIDGLDLDTDFGHFKNPISEKLQFDLRLDKEMNLFINDFTHVMTYGKEEISLKVNGNFDLSFSAKKSRIDIAFEQAINVRKIQEQWVFEESPKIADPKKAKGSKKKKDKKLKK
ncbi:MAG: hypothetical protein HRT89_23040, partial [Lentisphaeria bacterium]|nr:hypothetical protein [Lentisphaeria bacterium]